MKLHRFLARALALLLLPTAFPASAWGPEGHTIIGITSFDWLDPTSTSKVDEILSAQSGNNRDEAIAEACSWPDIVRPTTEWEWSAPLHYVNIPRHSRHYDRERDCSDGLCVTEGITRFAHELSRPQIDGVKRWQAFAWLCHLVADLHQPLHAGYRDDRGANRVIVQFRGQSVNLHQYWDRAMIRAFLEEGVAWERPFTASRWTLPADRWTTSSVMAWTDESHALAGSHAYPPQAVISEDFTRRSWQVTREQLQKAAWRLALILNAVLGEGEVIVEGR
jgi:hypothetical protein